MELKLDLGPEQIEKALVNAIIQSAIGKHIETSLLKALNGHELEYAVREILKNEVRAHAQRLFREDPAIVAHIEKAIRERVQAEVVEKAINEIIDGAVRKY